MANVGETLQDFTLKDQDNKDFKSEDLKGKRILLSFHPLARLKIKKHPRKLK